MNCKKDKLTHCLKILIFLVLFATFGICSYEDTFNEAITAYKSGDFNTAEKKFVELIDNLQKNEITSKEVWYNLGNCYFRQNKLGQARYCYEIAKLIDYYDKDVNYNIQLVKKITGNVNEENWFEYLTGFISYRDIFLILFLFNFILFASMSVSYFFNLPVFLWLRRISIIAIIMLLPLASGKYYSEKKLKGIVTETTNLLSAPEETTFTKFIPITEGKKVVILAEKDNYYAVYLPNDKLQGWIKKPTVKLIVLK